MVLGWLPGITLQGTISPRRPSFSGAAGRDDRLRRFAPAVEGPLCGHATLVPACVIMTDTTADKVRFITACAAGTTCLSPAFRQKHRSHARCPMTSSQPWEARRRKPCVAAIISSSMTARPNLTCGTFVRRLKDREGGVTVSAPCSRDAADAPSRLLAPHHGIPEDPVTGSARCMIFSCRVGRPGTRTIHALEVSQRGGEVRCRWRDDRTDMAGKAVTFIHRVASIPS